MEQYERLCNRFARLLEMQAQVLDDTAKSLKAEGRDDEATLQKINRNVTDIFAKMFEVCRKNIENVITLPVLREAVGGCESRRMQIAKGYPAICNGIMLPWKKKLQAAQRHGDTVGAVIEQNKLETAEDLLRQFTEMAQEGEQSDE